MRRSGPKKSIATTGRSWTGFIGTIGQGRLASTTNTLAVAPPFCPSEQEEIVKVVKNSKPVDHALPGHGWTLKKLRRWVASKLERSISRNTLRTILKQAGLSWKKCKKLLTKANPEKRAKFVEQFQDLFERMCRGEVLVVYVDEAHFHQDLDLGYTWAPKGEPTWRASTSPGLDKRINWYGAYNFSEGRCFIWHEGKCNSEHTIQFLQRLSRWLDEPAPKGGAEHGAQLVIIWDGASYHRSKIVQTEIQRLGIELIQLPGYSPDLNPIEGLWKWMREDVTQHYCHQALQELFLDCKDFIDLINQHPEQIISRLWPKFDLDPDFEKLLVSN